MTPEYIEKHLFNKSGYLSPAKISTLSNQDLKELVSQTRFLDEGTRTSIRLHCILKGITKKQKCDNCDNNTKWNERTKTFSRSCSNACGRLHAASSHSTSIVKDDISGLVGVHTPLKISAILGLAVSTVNRAILKFDLSDDKIKSNISRGHQELIDYITSISDTKVIINTRSVISPLELDIYIPEHRLAIEYNGSYWHSEQQGKDRSYHLNKTTRCEELGINLLHISQTDSLEIWKSVIGQKLGMSTKIYARKCEFKRISAEQYKSFLVDNHLQGSRGSSWRGGLFHEGALVSVMGIAKSRYDKTMDWELVRFCSLKGYSVTGGASKLLSKFTKKGGLVSYSNRRWSGANPLLYDRLGFEKEEEATPPNYSYIIEGEARSRESFQKHKLKHILGIFDDSKTEYQNMVANGFDRIWDSGNYKYTKYT